MSYRDCDGYDEAEWVLIDDADVRLLWSEQRAILIEIGQTHGQLGGRTVIMSVSGDNHYVNHITWLTIQQRTVDVCVHGNSHRPSQLVDVEPVSK